MVLEALNDYLLALRFMLEGGGPADLGLPMRVAALCAEPEYRSETKAVVDRALALERELWSGEPAPSLNGAEGAPTPAETAVAIEDLTRADAQGCSVRPPGKRSARDRRRDPACRRARRGRGRGRAAWRLRGMGPAGRGRGRPGRAGRRLGFRAGRRRLRGGAGRPPGGRRGGAHGRSGDQARAGRRRAGQAGRGPALDGRLRRVAGGARGPRRRPRDAGPRARGSNHDPVTPRAGGGARVHEQPAQARRAPDDRHRGGRADPRPLQRASRPAAAGARAGGQPRRLSLPASRDDRVGRARGEL